MLCLFVAHAILALAGASCSTCEVDDASGLVQTRWFAGNEILDQSKVSAKVTDDAHPSEQWKAHKAELVEERKIRSKEHEIRQAVKEKNMIDSFLAEEIAKVNDATERREAAEKYLARSSKKKAQMKSGTLQELASAQWEEATQLTEKAIAAERYAQFQRERAEKAYQQNAAQRAHAAALHEAELARRRMRSNNLTEEEAQEAPVVPVPSKLHEVKHAKAKVIKTRRASQRAEENAKTLTDEAVAASNQAWELKRLYQAAHPKAILEDKKIKESKEALLRAKEDEQKALQEKARLEQEKKLAEEKIANLEAGEVVPAQDDVVESAEAAPAKSDVLES